LISDRISRRNGSTPTALPGEPIDEIRKLAKNERPGKKFHTGFKNYVTFYGNCQRNCIGRNLQPELGGIADPTL
jgi:hypothetical protein